MAEERGDFTEDGLRIRRTRRSLRGIDKAKIAERVCNFATQDEDARSEEQALRLQRYAKFRMWVAGDSDWPWAGSCLSLDTEVLTETGWKPIGQVSVGEGVYSRNGAGIARYEPVEKRTGQFSDTAVHFIGKSIDILATPNHNMLVVNDSGEHEFIQAERFLNEKLTNRWIPLTSLWGGSNFTSIHGMNPKAYVRLLGWYISEGYSSGGGTGSFGISQSESVNPEKYRILEEDIVNSGISYKTYDKFITLHARSMPKSLSDEFRSLGRCHEKYIPSPVLRFSKPLLVELLDTLLLGDGHTTVRGATSYYTTSEKLAGQIQEIAQKIGIRATVIENAASRGGYIKNRLISGKLKSYIVHLNRKPLLQVKKLKVERINFTEPIEFACVSVPPARTIYVRRNGKAVWIGNSDIGIPDMMTDVLAVEDTLHNAVMSNRPVANARALQTHDVGKQDLIDDLLDTQTFIEQNGEKAVEESASCFVMDGCFTAFVPWVREDRRIVSFRTFKKFDENEVPLVRFEKIIRQEFPKKYQTKTDEQGWDWEIEDPDTGEVFTVKFYTARDGEIEMVSKQRVEMFNGPKIIVKDFEDVLTPPRTANLQIPGPSNPGGAMHVILRDSDCPVDEIIRLANSGFYDLISDDDIEKLKSISESKDEDTEKRQKDTLQGKEQIQQPEDPIHRTVTRYLCFDIYEMEKGGDALDVMWWVLKEPQILLKAKPLTEMYPCEPPRRPLAEASFVPVKGRREGIGLLEMMESMHDLKKQIFDQMVDAGTLGNLPFWFYRPSSNIQPETMKMWPGDGMPLNDPKNDVFFPNLNTGQAQSFGINILTLADQKQEKLTVRGDLQLGRVPIGRSAALRTSQNMQSLMSAGEARPERILRRFMMGWIEIMKQMHELNQHFLPEQKKGIREPGDDPYREISSSDDIAGRFKFDFSVNVMNASKIALQDSLERLLGVYVNPLLIQLGITTPDTIYRLARDWGRAHGQKPEQYLNKPSPEAMLAPILAEEAISEIMAGELPEGLPMEGAQAHLDKLMTFMQSPQFGFLDHPDKVALFRTYLRKVSERVRLEKLASAAGPGGMNSRGASQTGAPGQPPMLGPPQVQPNELLDETMPTAGGGANTGAIQ